MQQSTFPVQRHCTGTVESSFRFNGPSLRFQCSVTTGTYSGRSDLPLRVEAGAFHGRLVYFQPVWPCTRSTGLTPDLPTASQTLTSIAYFVGAIFVVIAVWIAHYNWRAGRGDLRGATRIGIYSAGLLLLAWPLGAHHVASPAEQSLIGDALANAAFTFVEYWLFYPPSSHGSASTGRRP